MTIAFINGFILAFGLIMPLGVQNVFIFNQGAAQRKFYSALPSIITAGLCDTFLIIIAVLGVSLLVMQKPWIKDIIFLFGFCFLLYMGYITWNTRVNKVEPPKSLSAKKQILFAASVSLLNPHALLDSIAIIGTNSMRFEGVDKWSFTFACILVSWLWFFGIAITGKIMHKLDRSGKLLNTTNKISAIIIWIVAFYLIFALIESLKSHSY